MARTHLSKTAEPIVLKEVDATERGSGCYKPKGFWYQVDGDWLRWCEAEDFGHGSHVHSLDLNDCTVLLIDTLRKLDNFHRRFSRIKRPGRYAIPEINWGKLSSLYDGLEIAPYRWERRLEFSWYYGWDCASGVIWRPKNAVLRYVGPVQSNEELSEVAHA